MNYALTVIAVIAAGATAYTMWQQYDVKNDPAQSVATARLDQPPKNNPPNANLSTSNANKRDSSNTESFSGEVNKTRSISAWDAPSAPTQQTHNSVYANENASIQDVTPQAFYLPESTKPVLPADYRDKALSSVNGDIIGGVVKNGPTMEATEYSPSGDDYSFPAVVEDESGTLTMVIGDEQLPNHSDRRQLSKGDGLEAALGDKVRIHYDMFSWATGKLIESTRHFEEQALEITLGDHTVPNVLQNALLNRTEGSRMQVVFEKGLTDLPQYMNQHDGYVLVVDIEEVVSTEEDPNNFAIQAMSGAFDSQSEVLNDNVGSRLETH